ncbi:MAG: hypothetical protein FWF99_02585, partial [Desulfovibrionaceae bacterium]|nr:hypothetical protein [Desulfovibrionaceae bacterium]
NDIVIGGGGNDIIYGGGGDNVLFGGGGEDIFALRLADMDGGVNHIMDFTPGEDILRFDDLFFNGKDSLKDLLKVTWDDDDQVFKGECADGENAGFLTLSIGPDGKATLDVRLVEFVDYDKDESGNILKDDEGDPIRITNEFSKSITLEGDYSGIGTDAADAMLFLQTIIEAEGYDAGLSGAPWGAPLPAPAPAYENHVFVYENDGMTAPGEAGVDFLAGYYDDMGTLDSLFSDGHLTSIEVIGLENTAGLDSLTSWAANGVHIVSDNGEEKVQVDMGAGEWSVGDQVTLNGEQYTRLHHEDNNMDILVQTNLLM